MAVADQLVADRYALFLGDCLEVLPAIPEGSVHLSVYSPPFGGLYHYSSSPRDLSNCDGYDDFFEHYAFVVDAVHRATMPGRMTAVHCMPIPSGNSGGDHLIDFPGDVVRLHTRCRDGRCQAPERVRAQGLCGHGAWELVARYAVWKEPLGVRNRTMAKDLAHKTVVEDSARCGNASADELVVLRKRGANPVPIAHPVGLTEYVGERTPPADVLPFRGYAGPQTRNRFSHWVWRQYASAFWDDVRIDRVLPFKGARDEEDEKHVHPLQLDVIERCVHLWSNPGETVLTPFMGVGSEVYGAVRLGRRGVGVELKPSYYRQAVANLAAVDAPAPEQADLFAEAEPAALEAP